MPRRAKRRSQFDDAPRLTATINQTEAYGVVFQQGAMAMAIQVEKLIYSASDEVELITDLHTLIQSVTSPDA